MKRKVLALAIGMLLIGLNLYAADGDLIVQGNLGVGTTSPAVKVSAVAGASNSWVADFYGLATSNILRIGNFNGYPTIGANNNAGTQWTDLSINFVGNTLFATSSGNIGIGTASPISKVNVRTGTDENLVVRPYSDFGTGFEGMLIHSINDGNSAHKVVGIEGSKVLINAGTFGNVGIGTSAPANILAVLQGSASDPIADSWTTYPCDKTTKEVIRVLPDKSGALDQLLGIELYEWKRKPLVSDEEIVDPFEKNLSASELEKRKQDLSALKSKMPKFQATRVGLMLDDPNIPDEIVAVDGSGKKGIDLVGYIGWLHATIKELAQRVQELEKR